MTKTKEEQCAVCQVYAGQPVPVTLRELKGTWYCSEHLAIKFMLDGQKLIEEELGKYRKFFEEAMTENPPTGLIGKEGQELIELKGQLFLKDIEIRDLKKKLKHGKN